MGVALDIKFSVAKPEVTWRLLSLQKANECCPIKELRKKSVWKEKKNWELAQVRVPPAAVPLPALPVPAATTAVAAAIAAQNDIL